MKHTVYYLFFFAVFCFSTSCQKIDLHNGTSHHKGLLNFSVKQPGQDIEYPATQAGPYEDGDTIYVKVPTSEEEPLDLTKLKPFASLENNSRISPGLPGLMDFSRPVELKVTDGEGLTRRHIIKIVPSFPRTVFRKSWFMTAQELGVLRPNISGLTVAGEHLLVADYSGGNLGATIGVRVYDKNTGAFQKIIAPPTTYCMQVAADDAGHFVMNRYNIYSAGFVVYYYEDIDASPKQILNYPKAAGCPDNLGRKISVIGNLKQGRAFIYATTNGNNNYYYWEFLDGTVVDPNPVIVKYASADAWTYAQVRRKSLEQNSDHYITYCNYLSGDANLAKGSRFQQFSSQMDAIEMNTQNHYYKILDFEVFKINETVFMAALTQGYAAWDATHIKVYDITDPHKMKEIPGNEGYGNFMLFTSEAYGGTNYNRYGDIAVDVDGNNVKIFASLAADLVTKAGVVAYTMKFNP